MYVDLLTSKNLRIFITSGPPNYSFILFKLAALFSQNFNSTKGPGLCPFFNAYSGSNFKTFFIYLVHVIIELS